MTDKTLSFDTLAIRAGHPHTQEQEHGEPIFTTSSFIFNSAQEAAARFAGEVPGNIYSRFTNPTVRNFEQRLAALEGVDHCVATASGMSAIASMAIALLKKGDHVVCSRSVFGTTVVLLQNFFAKFGVETTFVELTSIDAWKAAIKPNTRLFFLETPSNPLSEVADLEALVSLACQQDILVAVDNCFCTPALQKPFDYGVDLVVHSATKFIDGQGRCLGGAVLSKDKDLHEAVYSFMRSGGSTLSPFNAWVFLKGLETLRLRMDAHSAQALSLARWLQQQPRVQKVHYAGLESHPQHELAKKQQRGFGGVLSFEVDGGREAAWKIIDATRMLSITANLGDVKSTITHPATTTHGRLTPEDKAAAGITEGLLRIAVGLEDLEDIKADLARGFA